jgi:hypothetical protein
MAPWPKYVLEDNVGNTAPDVEQVGVVVYVLQVLLPANDKKLLELIPHWVEHT